MSLSTTRLRPEVSRLQLYRRVFATVGFERGTAVSLCPLPAHAGIVASSQTSLAFHPGSAVQRKTNPRGLTGGFSPSLPAGCGCARSRCLSPCALFCCCPFLSCPMRCCTASLTATTCSGSMDLLSTVHFTLLCQMDCGWLSVGLF